MGFAAQLCLSAPTVLSALERGCETSALWSATPYLLEPVGIEGVLLRTASEVDPRHFDVDHALRLWLGLLMRVAGEPLAPLALSLPDKRESSLAAELGIAIRDEPRVFGLYVARATLERVNVRANQRLYQLLSEYCEEQLAERRSAHATSQRVLLALQTLDDLSQASAEQLAKQLGCGVRTLHRRLHREGTTYRGVLDTLRRRRCLALLQAGKLSAKQVAHALGFAEPASFHRAFRRWTGCTVAVWQRRERGLEPRSEDSP